MADEPFYLSLPPPISVVVLSLSDYRWLNEPGYSQGPGPQTMRAGRRMGAEEEDRYGPRNDGGRAAMRAGPLSLKEAGEGSDEGRAPVSESDRGG